MGASTDFGARLRAVLAEKRSSLRAAARALNYDVAYLSRVANGRQRPSMQLAEALDEFLGTGGEFAEMVSPAAGAGSVAEPTGPAADIAYMRESAAYLLGHGDRHGGDAVASAAVQVWQSAQRRLDAGEVPEKEQRGYLSAVSEAAEVAGWLLFDAGQREAARRAFLESHMLAGHAGDRAMQWFALDMMAMLANERGHVGESRRIAEDIVSQLRVAPRVALIARVRRGGALARMGDRQRALADLDAARGGLEESLSPRDPKWAWWIDHREVTGHTAGALLNLGEAEVAAPKLVSALELATPRGAVLYRVGLLRVQTALAAWADAEREIHEISGLLDTIKSGRSRLQFREALRGLHQCPGVPDWLSAFASETEASLSARPAA